MKTYHGSCHCQAIQYTFTGDITTAYRCNCSHCKRKGFVLAFIPDTQFTLLQGENNLQLYQFNKKHIDHLFCKTCGVQSYSHGHDGNGNYLTAINLNCVDNFNQTTITTETVNGAAL